MKKYYVYIVLTRTNTIISKLIHMIKDDEYTHASITFDQELNQMYSFGRRTPYNPFIGHFRSEELNEGVYGFCKTLPGAVIEIEVTLEQYEKAKTLLEHFITHSDQYKYNYMGLVNGLLDKPLCNENRFLCSEFVYHLLKESGIVDLNMPRSLVRPQNLLDIEGKITYRGDLKAISPKINNEVYPKNSRSRRLASLSALLFG
ncbi:hypothetical protein AAC978_06335 [Desulfitobacterium sp. THU1]|uniref:hypothetical protein n=1 Tax=Desulfitobacterium sp. THU1 TaxID=3138072 RepID=UPI00311EA165